MSFARGNGQNGGHFYSNITQPVSLYCNFVVDSTNGNGLGMRSLKSNGYIESIFLHTSSTPGKIGSKTNPNPPLGYAMVTFKGNYKVYLGGFDGVIPPLASSNLTSVTNHSVYVITTLGTTTLAQWQAIGFPLGFVPAVGSSFVATASQAIGGTATVGAPGVPVTYKVSVVGDPNMEISNSSIASNGGAQILLAFYGATSAGSTVLLPTNPADGSVVGLTFDFDISSSTIDGL